MVSSTVKISAVALVMFGVVVDAAQYTLDPSDMQEPTSKCLTSSQLVQVTKALVSVSSPYTGE